MFLKNLKTKICLKFNKEIYGGGGGFASANFSMFANGGGEKILRTGLKTSFPSDVQGSPLYPEFYTGC
jgi:hypothetical protein